MASGNLEFKLDLKPPTENTRSAYEQFVIINSMIEKVREALILMIADANMLADAAVAGKLETRADASRHEGDFRKIVEGVNVTLDSVIRPVNEALRMSQEYAKQNFSARVDENLKVAGDFLAFKNALNNIGIAVSAAVKTVNMQTGNLSVSSAKALSNLKDVSTASDRITANAQKVNENAGISAQGVEQVLKAMEDMNSAIEQVTASMEGVSLQAKQASEASKNGAILAENVEKGMGDITKSTDSVNSIVKDIEKQMADISKIVVLIRDLANQTNLLALNAAIEAARPVKPAEDLRLLPLKLKPWHRNQRPAPKK